MKAKRRQEGTRVQNRIRGFAGTGTLLAIVTGLAVMAAPAMAQEPKPDPAGIATGDKSNVVDAGGNSFIISEPTDKSSPDYEKNKKAYETYYRNKADSRGLGLAIVARVAEAHEGSVSVDARPGGGSIFTLRLRPASS